MGLLTEEWKQVAKQWWSAHQQGTIPYFFCQTQKRCGQALHQWYIKHFRGLEQRLIILEQELTLVRDEMFANRGPDEIKLHQEQQLLYDYSVLLEMNHFKWAQRSREEYIKWGDANSKFFHA